MVVGKSKVEVRGGHIESAVFGPFFFAEALEWVWLGFFNLSFYFKAGDYFTCTFIPTFKSPFHTLVNCCLLSQV